MARARRRWIREQGLLDLSRLVFIDETSVNTRENGAIAVNWSWREICRTCLEAARRSQSDSRLFSA